MGKTTTRRGLVIVALVAAACGPIEEARFSADVQRELDHGRDFAARLTSESDGAPGVTAAIEAGYLERLRLGLGSPFRLIEYALQDPRLPRDERERLAWSLLAATLDGASYRIDPRALSVGDETAAARHLELVEGVITEAADPVGGLLAVRLAYSMAAAESTVSPRLQERLSRAAALVLDRAQSRSDARRLLRAAGSDTDPLALLTVWRVEGRFGVEKPAVPVAPDVEREAIALAPRLLQAIREIPTGPGVGPVVADREWPRPRSALGPYSAALLAAESAVYDAPPQTPVVVAVRWQARQEKPAPDPAVQRFFENAVNEERLAAELGVLRYTTGVDARVGRAVLGAALGLRAYAQERPWFPGFEGPTTSDLEDRFGLASVVFPETVPPHWRPYYRRMLETALSDLQRVLPALDVRGLNVRFEAREGSPGTLAVHDPQSRTVFIPTTTGAGTIAHELAHDIDWLTALRRYRIRGDYGTDRAVRLSDERLARVLRSLTTTTLTVSGGPAQPLSHANRPAEVFARSVDWFVAVALAREGRLDGYLSSVQDEVLTGYGTVVAPDVSGAGAQALMALLDEVAPVYPDTRRWFLGRYGRQRAPSASDLVRRLVEASLDAAVPESVPGPDAPQEDSVWIDAEETPPIVASRLARVAAARDRLEALGTARDSVLGTVVQVCRPVGYDNGTEEARRRLVGLVTRARARGIALDAATALAGREGREWVARRLDGRSRDPGLDPVVVEVLDELVSRVNALGETRIEAEPLVSPGAPASCGPVPFVTQ